MKSCEVQRLYWEGIHMLNKYSRIDCWRMLKKHYWRQDGWELSRLAGRQKSSYLESPINPREDTQKNMYIDRAESSCKTDMKTKSEKEEGHLKKEQ